MEKVIVEKVLNNIKTTKKDKLIKGKSKVINWGSYNKYLNNRGYLTIWFTQEGIEKWVEGEGRIRVRGRQREYSDMAIQTMYTLRQVFNLRLRQTEGFTRSILKIMKIKLLIPDYTTVSSQIAYGNGSIIGESNYLGSKKKHKYLHNKLKIVKLSWLV